MATATATAPEMAETRLLPLNEIIPADINRSDYGDLDELAQSIKQEGMLQAITVASREDGKYDLIAGERRFRATQMAGFDQIEAKILKDLDPVERIIKQLAENVHRKELLPLERARQLNALIETATAQGQKLTQADAAKRLGFKSQGQVSKYLTLYKLHTGVKAFSEAWDAGKIGLNDAIELGKLTKTPTEFADMVTRVLNDGLAPKSSVAEAVAKELEKRDRERRRDARRRELKATGANLAPEDWIKQGGRRIGSDENALNVPTEEHAKQDCHAVYVTATAELEPICMVPSNHATQAQTKPAESTDGEKDQKPETSANNTTGKATDGKATSAQKPTKDEGATATSTADDSSAEQEAERDAKRAIEEAERSARAEALRQATTARRAMLSEWLGGKRKLNRATADGYVFKTFVELALDQDDTNLNLVRSLLGVPDDEDDIRAAVRSMAAKGDDQLRRVAVALMCEWIESEIAAGDYQSARVTGHYGLLTSLGYELSDAEGEELDRPVPETT